MGNFANFVRANSLMRKSLFSVSYYTHFIDTHVEHRFVKIGITYGGVKDREGLNSYKYSRCLNSYIVMIIMTMPGMLCYTSAEISVSNQVM